MFKRGFNDDALTHGLQRLRGVCEQRGERLVLALVQVRDIGAVQLANRGGVFERGEPLPQRSGVIGLFCGCTCNGASCCNAESATCLAEERAACRDGFRLHDRSPLRLPRSIEFLHIERTGVTRLGADAPEAQSLLTTVITDATVVHRARVDDEDAERAVAG